MRDLFETKKITEAIFYANSESKKGDVKITMTLNKCFEIRQFDVTLNYWAQVYETSNTCDWNQVKKLANSLLN